MAARNASFRGLLLAGAGLLLASANRQGSAAEIPQQPQVTVEAHRATLQRRVQKFVAEITAGPSETSLEVWRQPVCPLVAGLPGTQGEAVLTRLSQIAIRARVPLAPKDCDANFVVVITPDPAALLDRWRARSHGDIFNGASPMTVRNFIETSRPVRVWYNDMAGDQQGSRMSSVAPPSLQAAPDDPFQSAPVNSNAEDTRLGLNAVMNLTSVILVVDTQSIQHMTVGQVADYVAMIGLGKIHSSAPPTDASTILNLFASDSQSRPAGLTEWDEAFLYALYHTRQGSRTQRAAITRSVVKDVEKSEDRRRR